MAKFDENAYPHRDKHSPRSPDLTIVRPRFRLKATRPSPLNYKYEYLVSALGKETANETVVDSIVWAFRRLKKTEESGDTNTSQ